jgi:hypothetical protein
VNAAVALGVVHTVTGGLDSLVDTDIRISAEVMGRVVHIDHGHVDHGPEEKLPKQVSSIEGYGRWAGRPDAAYGLLRP